MYKLLFNRINTKYSLSLLFLVLPFLSFSEYKDYTNNVSASEMVNFMLNDNSYLDVGMDIVVANVTKVCMILVSLFFFIRFLYSMYTEIIVNRGNNFFDLGMVLKGFMLIILLGVYPSLFGFISKSINAFSSALVETFDNNVRAQSKKDIFLAYVKKEQKNMKLSKEDVEYIVANASENAKYNKVILNNIIRENKNTELEGNEDLGLLAMINVTIEHGGYAFINAAVMIITLLGKMIIIMLILGMDLFLYAIGPLAIVVSIIPLWKDHWFTWFSTWVTVKCSVISLIVMDQVVKSIMDSKMYAGFYSQGLTGGEDNNAMLVMGINLAFLGLYVMVFWLTSRWIGDEDAGKVISFAAGKVAGTALKGAQMLGGLGGGKGGSSDGGGIAGSLLKGGKNQIDKN